MGAACLGNRETERERTKIKEMKELRGGGEYFKKRKVERYFGNVLNSESTSSAPGLGPARGDL